MEAESRRELIVADMWTRGAGPLHGPRPAWGGVGESTVTTRMKGSMLLWVTGQVWEPQVNWSFSGCSAHISQPRRKGFGCSVGSWFYPQMFSQVKVYIKHTEEAVVDFDACCIFQTYHLISPTQYSCFIKRGYAVRKGDTSTASP